MTTQRRLNSTLFMFIGGLLGSIFGLMGIFATAMGFTEGIFGYIKKKEKRKVRFENLCENMERFNYEFNYYKSKKLDKKIRSSSYQVHTTFNDPIGIIGLE